MENNEKNPLSSLENMFAKNWHIIIATVLIGYGLYTGFIPNLVRLALETALMTVALIAVVGITIFVLTDKQIKLLAKGLYSYATGRALESIVDFAPLITINSQIDSIKTEVMNDIGAARSNFAGYVENVEQTLKQKEEEKKRCLNLAAAAEKSGQEREKDSQLGKAGRIDDFIQRISASLVYYKNQEVLLDECFESCKYRIIDLENMRDVLTTEYNLQMQGRKILRSSRKALQLTNSPEFQLISMAAKNITDKYNNYIGDMKTFIKDAQQIFEEQRLQQSADSIRGEELFEELKRKRAAIDAGVENISFDSEVDKLKSLPAHVEGNDAQSLLNSAKNQERVPVGKKTGISSTSERRSRFLS